MQPQVRIVSAQHARLAAQPGGWTERGLTEWCSVDGYSAIQPICNAVLRHNALCNFDETRQIREAQADIERNDRVATGLQWQAERKADIGCARALEEHVAVQRRERDAERVRILHAGPDAQRCATHRPAG